MAAVRDMCGENAGCVYSVVCRANLLCEVMNTSMRDKSSFVVGVKGQMWEPFQMQ